MDIENLRFIDISKLHGRQQGDCLDCLVHDIRFLGVVLASAQVVVFWASDWLES